MKFGHEYKGYLEHSGFPPEWVESALSYSQLKKCIKRVKEELASIGLDVETLHQLLDSDERRLASLAGQEEDGENEAAEVEENEKPLRYEFMSSSTSSRKETMESGSSTPRRTYIRPKLLFLVDDKTGEPFSARLAPETKSYIHQLALNAQLTDVRITDTDNDPFATSSSRSSSNFGTPDENESRRPSRTHRLVEVPLTTDSEFFDLLQNELSSIVTLQNLEKDKLYSNITTVGRILAKATDPQDSKGKQDLAHWRRLFELYVDSRVFFATNERDHGLQNFSSAQKRYMLFLEKGQKLGLLEKFKKKESKDALQAFLAINARLLQNVRFVELNQTAMTKILKSTLFPSSHNL